MALTISMTGDTSGLVGNRRFSRGTIAFDSSYPTGGESFTAADIALKNIDFIDITAKGGYVFEFDYTNNKIIVYSGALAQVADTTDLSALTGVRFLALGV